MVWKPGKIRSPLISANQSNTTLKKIAKEMACVISGMTTGKKSRASRSLFPLYLPRAMLNAIIVPSTVDMAVATVPTKRLLRKAFSMSSVEKADSAPITLFRILPYQLKVNPVNEATDRLWLKEKSTSTRMGAHKKKYEKTGFSHSPMTPRRRSIRFRLMASSLISC